jgi:hypothetical protein
MENTSLRIAINGETKCVANADPKNQGATAIICYSRDPNVFPSVYIDVFGFVNNEGLDFLRQQLSIGDIVTIEIINSIETTDFKLFPKVSEESILESKLATFQQLKEELKDYLTEK